MTNIVALRRPNPGFAPLVPAQSALISMVSSARRDRHDAYWFKENAEALQMLAATGAAVDLTPYASLARTLLGELQFFPQYYRMYLSIALDLRALGLADVPVEAMADYILAEGLAGAEVSDMHRAEAQLLLSRAGRPADDADLRSRLAYFTAQSARFAVPNRRAAYDLTHVVFHLADYGRRAIAPDAARSHSLMMAGIVAYLDDDMDLLAEVTFALRFGGDPVPAAWDAAIADDLQRFVVDAGPHNATPQDDYHAWLVQNWAVAVAGGTAFEGSVVAGAQRVTALRDGPGTLRAISLALMDMGPARTADWAKMSWRLAPHLTALQRARLAEAEALPAFPQFFARFARCGTAMA